MAKPSTVGPNRRPGRDEPAAPGVCLFLGKEYQQDETVCWRSRLWRCDGGSWVKTDEAC